MSAAKKSEENNSFTFKFFKKGFEESKAPLDSYETLNENEKTQIKEIRKKSLIISGLIGALGVALLYTPILIKSDLFPLTKTTLFIFSEPIDIPIWFTLYGIVLAVLEIYILSFLNLRAVRKIAIVCGFPNRGDIYYQEHIRSLYKVGLEKPNTKLLEYNLDPFLGMSKWKVFAFQTFNKMKATLSNMLVKVILARVFGRFAIRAYIDLVGMPIFAFWNIYATNKVVKEAKIRIMAPGLIKKMTFTLKDELKDETEFKELLYACLQFVTVIKRDFHHNHYLLARRLITTFQIDTKNQKEYTIEEVLEMVKNAKSNVREGLAKVLVFGMLVDGKLSRKEKNALIRLYEEGLIHLNYDQIKVWEKSFRSGNGLKSLFETDIATND